MLHDILPISNVVSCLGYSALLTHSTPATHLRVIANCMRNAGDGLTRHVQFYRRTTCKFTRLRVIYVSGQNKKVLLFDYFYV